MKRSILVVLIVVAVAAAVLSYFDRDRGTQWTTKSPEALNEFLLGQEARMRLYADEAKDHFTKAAELDEGFVVAKLMSMQFAPHEQRETLLKEMKSFDLVPLEDHERFLVEYSVARVEGEQETADVILDEFLTQHPRSPWGLEAKAGMAWGRYDLDEAEKLYSQLIEADPNWVTAQNNLGYIAMGRGDFAEADDHFRTYQYIAPDQANPHDSRGEMLTLTGHYDEAWDEFQAALEIRPDFCASYGHQLTLASMAGWNERFDDILQAGKPHCGERLVARLNCAATLWNDFLSEDYKQWQVEREDGCLEMIGADTILHRMAAFSGNFDLATELEAKMGEQLKEYEELGFVSDKHPVHGIKLHLQGVRLLAAGDTQQAIDSFRGADKYFFYMGHDPGVLKLWNYINLSVALESIGDAEAAERELQRALSVNSQLSNMVEHAKRDLARIPAAT